jgi:hypothetical protein
MKPTPSTPAEDLAEMRRQWNATAKANRPPYKPGDRLKASGGAYRKKTTTPNQ